MVCSSMFKHLKIHTFTAYSNSGFAMLCERRSAVVYLKPYNE